MNTEELLQVIKDAVDEIKGFDIHSTDVQGKSNVADYFLIASGNTDRQVKAIANNIIVKSKEKGIYALGVEGLDTGEWVLVDLGDIVVHIMQPKIRDFYQLEKLWEVDDNSDTVPLVSS